MFLLGSIYNVGHGVDQNYTKSIQYYKQAAKLNDYNAIYASGVCFASGRGVQKNYTKAIEYYERDADLGCSDVFYRLSGMNPLRTVCYFSIGPLVNQISLALESFIETIWVSKAIGKDGMSAVSSYSPFESITQAFGLTASFAGSCAISAMIATNKTDKKEASQVIVDLLRVCIIVGVVLPAVLCPLVEKSVRWFGTSEKIAKIGFKYILPVLICTFSTCMFLAVTGFIEGEGRPILFIEDEGRPILFSFNCFCCCCIGIVCILSGTTNAI